MLITLDEIKNYLRVDLNEDDRLLETLIVSGEQLCMDVARISDVAVFEAEPNARIAVMYVVAYLYEHREKADHHELMMTLRALLFGSRKEAF